MEGANEYNVCCKGAGNKGEFKMNRKQMEATNRKELSARQMCYWAWTDVRCMV